MCASVVSIGPGGDTKGCSSPDGEVLTDLCMLLWVQVGLNKDIGLALSSPVPVNDLAAELRDIAIVQLVMCLFQSGSLLRAGGSKSGSS